MYNSSFASLTAAFAFMNAALSAPTDLISSLVKRQDSVPRLVQYVQTFSRQNNDNAHLSLLPLLRKDTGVTHVLLAALHINGPNGDISLNDDSPNSTIYDRTWSEAATLQENGISIMIMMGGAAQGSYDGRLCNSNDGSVDDFYLPLVDTLKYHNIDGLDLDIEEEVPISCPQNLVTRLRSDFGDDFIITMAPVASDLTSDSGSAFGGFSYTEFDQSSAGANVNWYNGQYYSGFVEGSLEESYQNAINNGYSPDRLVMGVLDSENDGAGFVSLSDVEGVIANLKDDYSNFGGVDGWEYFDAGSSDGIKHQWMWVKQVGDALFGSSSKRSIGRRSRHHHTPPLPTGVAKLMAEGHGQIDAARALRLAKGDEEAARKILTQS